jgi:hypothetical protein
MKSKCVKKVKFEESSSISMEVGIKWNLLDGMAVPVANPNRTELNGQFF